MTVIALKARIISELVELDRRLVSTSDPRQTSEMHREAARLRRHLSNLEREVSREEE